MRYHWNWILLVFALHASAQVTVAFRPNRDEIVAADTVTLTGQSPPNTIVKVTVNGATLQTVSNGTWEVPGVSLQPGFNSITVDINGIIKHAGISRADITAQSPQKIRFDWSPAAEDDLRRIAARTLNNPALHDPIPTAQQQDLFVVDVKQRMEELVLEVFNGIADIVTVTAADAATHTVFMTAAACCEYGQFPNSPDCMNQNKNDESHVAVGYLAKGMIDDFDEWKPMKPGDDFSVRVEDVAQSLARTAAHEIAHSLGLVGRSGDCNWMQGNSLGHTFPDAPPDVFRSADGQFLMDDGREPYQRLGYATKLRSGTRFPAEFCNFNRIYLHLLLP